jgi:hypothetical protein
LEALADRVVVGRAGRDLVVAQVALGHRGRELTAGEFWAVVGQDPGELGPDLGQAFGDVVDEAGGVTGRLVPGDQGADPIAGSEVAEPERAIFGLGGQDGGGRRGQLGQGGHPLGPSAEPVPTQELLHASGRQAHPTLGQVLDQTPSADVGRATASASTAST